MLNTKWIRNLNLVVPITTAILLFGIFGASFVATGNIFSTGITWGVVLGILNVVVALINYQYKY